MEKTLRFKEFSAYKYNLISQGDIILYLHYKINISNLKSPYLDKLPFILHQNQAQRAEPLQLVEG